MNQSDSESTADIRGAGWRPPDLARGAHATGGADATSGRARQSPPPSPPPPAPGAIVGVARDVRQRAEQHMWGQSGQTTVQVWTFRIDRYDAHGAALPPVPVEMRGSSFEGSIDNGDWVEAPGVWRPGRTLHPRRVRNLTTGAPVGVRGWGLGAAITVILVVLLLVVMVVVFLAVTSAMLSSHAPTPIGVPR
jgi:hypothetical protein